MDTRSIERLDVRSLALIVAVMALAWTIIISLVRLVLGLGAGPSPGLAEVLILIVASPLAGVVVGAVIAILFNLAVVFVGGLEVDLAEH